MSCGHLISVGVGGLVFNFYILLLGVCLEYIFRECFSNILWFLYLSNTLDTHKLYKQTHKHSLSLSWVILWDPLVLPFMFRSKITWKWNHSKVFNSLVPNLLRVPLENSNYLNRIFLLLWFLNYPSRGVFRAGTDRKPSFQKKFRNLQNIKKNFQFRF